MTVPKSRVRKKPVYTPPPRSARRKSSPPWVAPAMVACLVVGLVWIALYYITNGDLAGMSVLGFWNLVIGFVLIIIGVVLSTQWR
jgi:Cell division protein CrgA